MVNAGELLTETTPDIENRRTAFLSPDHHDTTRLFYCQGTQKLGVCLCLGQGGQPTSTRDSSTLPEQGQGRASAVASACLQEEMRASGDGKEAEMW